MNELTQSMLDKLKKTAQNASEQAYRPYSGFRVGAAILTDDDEIFSGCNVENASYGLSICAERNAIFQMIANGKRIIHAVAVYTPTKTPTAPCGACRQVIYEFGPTAEIVSFCETDVVLRRNLSELLIDAFGPHDLH